MKISANQYAKSLFELTAGKSEREINSAILSFIKFLQKKRQLKLAGKIIEKFSKIYNKKNGIVEAEITASRELNDAMIDKIKEFIKKKYGVREVVLSALGGKNIVDEKIKGGIIIKVGDEVVDGSVGGRLGRLRKCLNH